MADINTALSSDEIERVMNFYGKPIKFLLYSDIHKIVRIEQLLPRTLILYELDTIGHFCCVFVNRQGINFFDPLGFCIDEELKLVRPDYAASKHHDFPYLANLLVNCRYNIIYNDKKLQARHTSVCGHWCVLRMLCEDMTDKQFEDAFKGIPNRDRAVAVVYRDLKKNMSI
jgi:hypothetical protein